MTKRARVKRYLLPWYYRGYRLLILVYVGNTVSLTIIALNAIVRFIVRPPASVVKESDEKCDRISITIFGIVLNGT